MNIILATCGTRGDVQPMVAVTLALRAAGHRALLLGPPERAGWAGSMGCPYRGVGRDVTAMVGKLPHSTDARAALVFLDFLRKELADQFQTLPPLIRGADLILGSSLMFGAASMAEAAGIPYRYIAFTTQVFPSCRHPFLAVSFQNLPKALNRLSWTAARLLDQCNITFSINRWRKTKGLGPVRDAWDHILGNPVIVACDRALVPVPPDVTKNFIQTGYPHLDEPENPEATLERFLETGVRPIYAGFGSMPPRQQARAFPLLIQAARRIGRRIILPGSGTHASIRGQSPDLFWTGPYPHRLLFPRLDAVIHHGGAGTTAAAAASGVPQIIVPHILDQFFHGWTVFKAGLGPRPIPRRRLSLSRLTSALDQALNDPFIRQTARKTGEAIHPGQSLRAIVRAVERAVS